MKIQIVSGKVTLFIDSNRKVTGTDKRTALAVQRLVDSLPKLSMSYLADQLELRKLGKITVKGGPGSGNFGHSGRPGKRGGSSASKTSSFKFVADTAVNSGFRTSPLSEKIFESASKAAVAEIERRERLAPVYEELDRRVEEIYLGADRMLDEADYKRSQLDKNSPTYDQDLATIDHEVYDVGGELIGKKIAAVHAELGIPEDERPIPVVFFEHLTQELKQHVNPTTKINHIIDEHQFSKDELTSIKKGITDVMAMVDRSVSFTGDVPLVTIYKIVDGRFKRSHANGISNSIHLSDNGFTERVVKHELGHIIEYNNPAIARRAKDLLITRTRGSEQQPLGKGFEPDEVYKEGGFIDKYVGKIYARGTTEIVAMGLEHISTPYSAMSFAQSDPEHFKFMIDVLTGYIK